MKCIICNNSNLTKVSEKTRDSNKHSVMKCSKCDMVQLSPIPTERENQEFYNQGKQIKNINEPTKINILRRNQKSDTIRRANFLSKFAPPNSTILDIGAGFGFFIEEVRKRNFQPTGIEISRFARKISEKITDVPVLNIDIIRESLKMKFDVITLFHVLEHIRKPIEFLRVLRSNLKQNGKLIIEVPNFDDLMVKSNDAYRNFYWQRAHLLYFNKKTLMYVVKKAGFLNCKTYYEQRYSLNNFMNWIINHQPQIQQPSFNVTGNYQWLEDIYKDRLIKMGKSDTLILIAIK